jgi:predicted RNA-binding Zn-ribbon protein involved in translation (DUF1610 family)
MRTFKCYTCDHTWQLPHGKGGRGIDLQCPACGSNNIHREDRPSRGGWQRRGRPPVSESDPGKES